MKIIRAVKMSAGRLSELICECQEDYFLAQRTRQVEWADAMKRRLGSLFSLRHRLEQQDWRQDNGIPESPRVGGDGLV